MFRYFFSRPVVDKHFYNKTFSTVHIINLFYRNFCYFFLQLKFYTFLCLKIFTFLPSGNCVFKEKKTKLPSNLIFYSAEIRIFFLCGTFLVTKILFYYSVDKTTSKQEIYYYYYYFFKQKTRFLP